MTDAPSKALTASENQACIYMLSLFQGIDSNWSQREGVDWSEAEQMVSAIRDSNVSLLTHRPEVVEILEYSSEIEDWDSGYVCNWPQVLITALNELVCPEGS